MSVFSSPDFNCGKCALRLNGFRRGKATMHKSAARPCARGFPVTLPRFIRARKPDRRHRFPTATVMASTTGPIHSRSTRLMAIRHHHPEPPGYVMPPLFDGSELDHFELLVASSGSDQVHAWNMQGEWQGMVVQAETNPFPDKRTGPFELHPHGRRRRRDWSTCCPVLRCADLTGFPALKSTSSSNSQPPFSTPGGLVGRIPAVDALQPRSESVDGAWQRQYPDL